jgi:hypothetical protein
LSFPPGLLLSGASFLLLAGALAVEAGGRVVLSSRWLLRAPLLLGASSEVVKARLVVTALLW